MHEPGRGDKLLSTVSETDYLGVPSPHPTTVELEGLRVGSLLTTPSPEECLVTVGNIQTVTSLRAANSTHTKLRDRGARKQETNGQNGTTVVNNNKKFK